jgi:hypothetical protein
MLFAQDNSPSEIAPATTVAGEAPREKEHRPIVDRCAWQNEIHFVRGYALELGTVFIAG